MRALSLAAKAVIPKITDRGFESHRARRARHYKYTKVTRGCVMKTFNTFVAEEKLEGGYMYNDKAHPRHKTTKPLRMVLIRHLDNAA